MPLAGGSKCRFGFQDEDSDLINNRQNGRRRGRGGNQRPGGGGGGGGQGQRDSGNRIDSRARGNAAQLLEKYRNMARDAQMSGDRVNTEYYLQFADHYFRVLADQRGRNDDQPMPRRLRDDFDQFDGDDDFGDEGEPIRAEEQVRVSETDNRPRRDDRPRDDRPRDDRPRDDRQRDDRPRDDRQRESRPRDDRPRDDRPREDRQRDDRPRGDDRQRDGRNGHADRNVAEQPEPRVEREPVEPVAAAPAADAAAGEEARTPRRRTRKPREETGEQAASFDIDRLPPALGAPAAAPVTDVAATDAVEEAPKPRRRRVRPAAEVTPAE